MKTPQHLALLSLLLPLAALRAQDTYTWTGAIDGAWSNASNWSPGSAYPGSSATDIASFGTGGSASPISLGSAVTIGRIEFAAGGDAYTFSGAELQISRDPGIFISNQSGREQVFNNAVRFTSTGTVTLSVAAGGAITFNSTVAGPGSSPSLRNLIAEGGGTVNFNGTFANFTTFNQFQVKAGTTVNYNTTSQNGVSNFWADGGRINLLRGTGTSGISLTLRSNNSEIYIAKAGVTVGAQGLNFRGDDAGTTKTFGADFEGTGTATYSGTVRLNNNASAANNTYRLYAATGNTLALTGTVIDSLAAASGTRVLIDGPGVVRFAGTSANTSLTPIVIDGTLELAKTAGVDAIAGGAVTINTGGALRLAADNQIADATALVFAGGAFEVNGRSETLGGLTVGAAGGVLDFGGVDADLVFAGLDSISGTLLISGWTLGSSITFTDITGIGDSELAKISFDGFGGAMLDGNRLVVSAAIPEPASAAFVLGGVALLGGLARRRRRVIL
jgi:hypothetical protein